MARRFVATRKEEDVEIELPNGTVRQFKMLELMGDQREEYLSFQAGKMKLDRKGRPTGVGDMKGVSLRLLSLCLYDSLSVTPISETELAALQLPGRVIGELCRMAVEMSGLGDDAEEEAKNS